MALICMDNFEGQIARIRGDFPQCKIQAGPPVSEPGMTLPRSTLQGVQVLLSDYPPANFGDLDSLQFIQLTSTGYEQVLHLPLHERGIRVSNSRGAFDVPIAEWNVLMVLLWQRRLLEMLEHQREAIWDPSAKFQDEVRGRTLGFYGYGGSARETARLAKTMGLTVWALTRDGKVKQRRNIYCPPGVGDPEGALPDRVFSHQDKESFFAGLDYLLITMPLSSATRGLLGERELRCLRTSAVVINPSRAAIIDEKALLRSLRENWIRGASLDVHYAYPLPPEHPLWSMRNVVLTPHISGSSGSRTYPELIRTIFSQNLSRLLTGEPVLNEVSSAELRGE